MEVWTPTQYKTAKIKTIGHTPEHYNGCVYTMNWHKMQQIKDTPGMCPIQHSKTSKIRRIEHTPVNNENFLLKIYFLIAFWTRYTQTGLWSIYTARANTEIETWTDTDNNVYRTQWKFASVSKQEHFHNIMEPNFLGLGLSVG